MCKTGGIKAVMTTIEIVARSLPTFALRLLGMAQNAMKIGVFCKAAQRLVERYGRAISIAQCRLCCAPLAIEEALHVRAAQTQLPPLP